MELIFWICLFLVVYTFIGYGILLLILVKLKSICGKKNDKIISNGSLPTCSIIIAAFNEEKLIEAKIENTLSLNYPDNLLQIYIVADGSSDQTVKIISKFSRVNLLFQKERKGKVDAIDRAMKHVRSEVVVFTDANTFLNKEALSHICHHYLDPDVGGVAGEKRIRISSVADASTSGENFYWKYESALKRLDSELYSTVGAAGELFSIRRKLYESISKDTILDDFMISMKIVMQGYRIVYEPLAYALETSSANINEELKRKIRIAAGGIQSIVRLKALLNPIKYPILSFQYISHRVLRWSVTPILLLLLFGLNIKLAIENDGSIYDFTLVMQVVFYMLAILGLWLRQHEIKFKILFIPLYFCVMNYAVIAGFLRFFTNTQKSIWEKSERKEDCAASLITNRK